MLVRTKSDQVWKQLPEDGVEFCGLRQNDTNGGAGLVRMRKGARFPRHGHPGWEEALMLSGVVNIGGNRLVEGDYLFTEAGETHDAVAEESVVFFVSSEKGIELLSEDGDQ